MALPAPSDSQGAGAYRRCVSQPPDGTSALGSRWLSHILSTTRCCTLGKVYLPTIVRGRVIWHLGYTTEASAIALTQSYGEFQRAASQQEPSYRVKGILTDGF